jgi:hypothetical protein
MPRRGAYLNLVIAILLNHLTGNFDSPIHGKDQASECLNGKLGKRRHEVLPRNPRFVSQLPLPQDIC